MWLVWLQLLHYFKSDDGYFQNATTICFFIFHYGVANLNKAVQEKSNKVVKFCGSKIENTHLKGKHDPTF